MINWWAIHYDPEHYPEPHLFKPERFVGYKLPAFEEAVLADPYQRPHFSYGGGRRICPGMHVAERSLFINIARLLWGFDIDLKRGDDGEIIPVDFSLLGTLGGSNCSPSPFACGIIPCFWGNSDWADIKVRSAHHERILREEWEQAQKVGIDFASVNFDRLWIDEVLS